MDKKFAEAAKRSAKFLWNSLPVIAGILLLVGLLNTFLPKSFYVSIFHKNVFLDTLSGSFMGSILMGNPITSYVLGGELLKQGISLLAVTSFLVAWVTVGVIQFPAEMIMLGKKFAILRNVFSFIFSIIVALVTVYLFNIL